MSLFTNMLMLYCTRWIRRYIFIYARTPKSQYQQLSKSEMEA